MACISPHRQVVATIACASSLRPFATRWTLSPLTAPRSTPTGKMVDREVYSHLAIRKLAQAVATFPNLHLALFDRTKSFLLDDECKFVREVDKDLPNAERIWELPDPSVNIIKASIFCDDGAVMDSAYVLQRELGQLFTFAPSGNAWIDAMQPGVSKASGIAQLAEHYGIGRDEVMAFGDSMNDYEIIRFVGTAARWKTRAPRSRRWPIAWWVVIATTPSSRSSVACWRVSLNPADGDVPFLPAVGGSPRGFPGVANLGRGYFSYPAGLLLLGEGGHDGAGDAVVVVVVFGDGAGGLAVLGLGVDHGHAVARCLQHGDVVDVVAERPGVGETLAQVLAEPREGRPLGGALTP